MARTRISLKRFHTARSAQPIWIIGALIVAGLLVWLLWPKAPEPLRANLVAAAASADVSGFARAEGPQPQVFPADHGPHNDFQTEWWYYTGNLTAETGEHFGYQLTFFRRALTPPDQRSARDTAWAADQVYMAHLALTDVSGGKHYSFEKLARGAAGLAGAQAEPFRVWLEDWSVAGSSARQTRLRAAAKDPASGLDLSLDLNLADLKGPILQGDRGYSRKGPEPGNASYYVSLPRIATEGKVTVGGKAFAVDGLSWMDHEWSTSALGAAQAGWDWFSIQLDDNTELMLFRLRRADGSADGFSSGTLIAADGSTRTLGPGDFSIEVTDRWRSPRTGGEYPAGWLVTVPSADLRLTISPWLADQEMDVSQKYWEGAVKAEGMRNGQRVAGNGYVELTGYAGSMQGQF
jgi:predicted secreted hydrolase